MNNARILHERRHKRALCVRLFIESIHKLEELGSRDETYHRANVWVRHSIKLLILELIVGADIDICSPVLCRVAIPRSREHYETSVENQENVREGLRTSDAPTIVLNFITIHAHFVTSNNSFKAVLLAESLGNVRAELHAHTSLAWSATLLFLGVSPKHLHHQPCLPRLSLGVTVQLSDVIQGDIVV